MNYERVKDNVVVVPSGDIIAERGFLPDYNCVMYVSEYHCMLSCGSDGMILLWEADKTPMEVSDSESQSDSDITSDGGFVPPIIREMFGEDV